MDSNLTSLPADRTVTSERGLDSSSTCVRLTTSFSLSPCFPFPLPLSDHSLCYSIRAVSTAAGTPPLHFHCPLRTGLALILYCSALNSECCRIPPESHLTRSPSQAASLKLPSVFLRQEASSLCLQTTLDCGVQCLAASSHED